MAKIPARLQPLINAALADGAPCLVGYDLCTGSGSWTGTTP